MSNPPLWLEPEEIQERLHILEEAVHVLFLTHPEASKLRAEWDKTVSHLKRSAEEAGETPPGRTLSEQDKRIAESRSKRFRIAEGYRTYIEK